MVRNQQADALKSAYAWVLDQLRREEVPYGALVMGLPPGQEISLAPATHIAHPHLSLRREGYDLNDQPNKEALVREWGRELKRKAEGWIDPDREIPKQRENVRLKVLDLAHEMEFEVDGMLDGQEWINAGNGQHLHRSHFQVLGWRRD